MVSQAPGCSHQRTLAQFPQVLSWGATSGSLGGSCGPQIPLPLPADPRPSSARSSAQSRLQGSQLAHSTPAQPQEGLKVTQGLSTRPRSEDYLGGITPSHPQHQVATATPPDNSSSATTSRLGQDPGISILSGPAEQSTWKPRPSRAAWPRGATPPRTHSPPPSLLPSRRAGRHLWSRPGAQLLSQVGVGEPERP